MKHWKKYALTAGTITIIGSVGIITTNVVLLNNAIKNGDTENVAYYASNLLPLSNAYEKNYYDALGRMFYKCYQEHGVATKYEAFRNIVNKLKRYDSNHVDAKFLRIWVDNIYELENDTLLNDMRTFDAIVDMKPFLHESTLEHKELFYSLLEQRMFTKFCHRIDKKQYKVSGFEEELALVIDKNRMYETINKENILKFSGERSYDTMIFESKKIDSTYALKFYEYWKKTGTNKESIQKAYEQLSHQLTTYPEYKTPTYRNYEKLIHIIYDAQQQYEEYKKMHK